MAFVKKTWKDRLVEFAGRRSLTKVSGDIDSAIIVDVTRSEGEVSQAGDTFSAANMNDLEERIEDAFQEVSAKIDNTDTFIVPNYAQKTNIPSTYTAPEDGFVSLYAARMGYGTSGTRFLTASVSVNGVSVWGFNIGGGNSSVFPSITSPLIAVKMDDTVTFSVSAESYQGYFYPVRYTENNI